MSLLFKYKPVGTIFQKNNPIIVVKRFDFTPVPGWSLSRYDVFQTCKRQLAVNRFIF
ncbi:hypothetical protein ES703_65797 [subsurface metagenome]